MRHGKGGLDMLVVLLNLDETDGGGGYIEVPRRAWTVAAGGKRRERSESSRGDLGKAHH